MLANVPRELLSAIMFIVPVIAVFGGITAKGIAVIKYGKTYPKTLMLVLCINMLSIFFTAASWILNMGWIRLILTVLAFPFIHSLIYTCTNLLLIKSINKYPLVKWLNIGAFLTYVLSYAFFPDAGDLDGYVFFGLIRDSNEALYDVAFQICFAAAMIHIVLYITQIVSAVVLWKFYKRDKGTVAETAE